MNPSQNSTDEEGKQESLVKVTGVHFNTDMSLKAVRIKLLTKLSEKSMIYNLRPFFAFSSAFPDWFRFDSVGMHSNVGRQCAQSESKCDFALIWLPINYSISMQ